jgi:hypothetical protein
MKNTDSKAEHESNPGVGSSVLLNDKSQSIQTVSSDDARRRSDYIRRRASLELRILRNKCRIFRLHLRKLGINCRLLRVLLREHIRYNLSISGILLRHLIKKGIIHLKMFLQDVHMDPYFRWWSVAKKKLLNSLQSCVKFHRRNDSLSSNIYVSFKRDALLRIMLET